MKIRTFCGGDLSGKAPQWYWSLGLHDAEVLKTERIALDYDYTQRNPIRNCLKLHLDSSPCTYDTTVKTISLYNYKVLQEPIERKIDGCWWFGDRLEFKHDAYLLTIALLDQRREHTFVVRFEHAEVERTK